MDKNIYGIAGIAERISRNKKEKTFVIYFAKATYYDELIKDKKAFMGFWNCHGKELYNWLVKALKEEKIKSEPIPPKVRIIKESGKRIQ